MKSPIKGGHPDEVPLTPEEQEAIADLTRLVEKWPRSLWILGRQQILSVMRRGAKGEYVQTPMKHRYHVIINDSYTVIRADFERKEVGQGPGRG